MECHAGFLFLSINHCIPCDLSIQESFEAQQYYVQDQSRSTLLLNLQRQTVDSTSAFIIERDGRGPYIHFAYPIGGPVTPNDEMRHDIAKRRNSSFASFVPDVLPIQLPSHAISPVIARPKVGSTASSSPRDPDSTNSNKLQTPGSKTAEPKFQGNQEG